MHAGFMTRFLFLILLMTTGLPVAMAQPAMTSVTPRRPLPSYNITDTATVGKWLTLAGKYYPLIGKNGRFGDSSLRYASKAQILAGELKYLKGLQAALILKAKIYHLLQGIAVDAGKSNSYNLTIARFEKEALLIAEKYLNPAAQADLLLGLADAYNWQTEEIGTPSHYYTRAADLYNKQGNVQQHGLALMKLGIAQYHASNLGIAEETLHAALKLLIPLKYNRLHMAYSALSYIRISRGEYKKGTSYGLKAVAIGEQVGDTSIEMAEVYKNAGYCYDVVDDDANIAYYARKAFDIAKKNDNFFEIYSASAQLGKVLRKTSPDSCVSFLKSVLRQYPLPAWHGSLIDAYSEILSAYNMTNQFREAEYYADKMLVLAATLPEMSLSRSYVLTKVINFYVNSKQYAKAAKLLPVCKKIEEQNGQIPALATVYLRMSFVDSAMGNYKSAYESFRTWYTIMDSIEGLEQKKQISELQIAFQTEKQKKDILLLQKDNRRKSDSLNRSSLQRNIVLTLSLFLLIIFCLLYYQFRLKRNAHRQISSKNKMLEKLVQEKEWLLRELHHRVKNNLQTVVSLLESQAVNLKDDALFAIHESQQRVFAISLIHKKLYMDEYVKTVDMAAYIPELVGYIKEMHPGSSIEVRYDIHEITLDISQAVPVALIINEAVTNTFKYAFTADQQRKLLTISMAPAANGNLQINITDNGTGIDHKNATGAGEGLGMRLLFGLTDDIGGTISVINDKGTLIQIEFPPFKEFTA